MKRFMTRFFTILVTASLLFVSNPLHAYACDGWNLSCMLGITDIADRNAAKQENLAKTQAEADAAAARIKADTDAQTARIKADSDARIAEANRQIEAQRVQGQITMVQAAAVADAFRAKTESDMAEKLAAIQAASDAQIAGLTQAANVSITGIHETGQTERSKAGWGGMGNIITVIVVGAIIAYFINRRTKQSVQPAQPIVVMLQNGAMPMDRQIDQARMTALPYAQYRVIEQKDNQS